MKFALAAVLLLGGAPATLAGDGALVKQLNGFLTLGGGYQALPEGGGGTTVQHIFPNGDPSPCRVDDGIPGDCTLIDSYSVGSGADPTAGWLGALSGSLAFPLDYKSGLQLDAAAGRLADQYFADGTLHLFWGEPGTGQFGPLLNFWTYDGAERLRVGGELQGYWDDLTGYLQAGYQWGDDGRSLSVAEGFYVCGRGTWYVDPDAALWLGGGYGPDASAVGFVGSEL